MRGSSPGPVAVRKSSPLSQLDWRLVYAIALPVAAIVMALPTVLLLLSLLHIARPYSVPTATMSPAINKGEYIYTDGIAYAHAAPHRGDIVCFSTTGIPFLEERGDAGETFIKRIVGLPGENISIHSGQLWVNGVAAPELTKFRYEPAGNFLAWDGASYLVPAASYFVLGDNSHSSLDSRFWGCVPAANIRGQVWLRFWPPGRIGLIK